MKKEKERDE